MRTTAWNCRGLGIDSTVRRLKEIHRQYLPDIICLSETKQQDDHIRDIGSQLEIPNYFSVPHVVLSGGLVIYWKQHVQLSVLSSSPNLIDCTVLYNGSSFYLSFVYGHSVPSMRHQVWERLERLAFQRRNEAWFALLDFNELLGNHEKLGGRIRSEASFADFRTMVRHCDFTDVSTISNRFSCVSKRGDDVIQ